MTTLRKKITRKWFKTIHQNAAALTPMLGAVFILVMVIWLAVWFFG